MWYTYFLIKFKIQYHKDRKSKLCAFRQELQLFSLCKALNKSKSCYIFKIRFRHLLVDLNIIRKKFIASLVSRHLINE